MCFVVELANPFVPGDSERYDLSQLDDDERSHIHGELRIVIAGRLLPSLGYFGPDDVCLNTWCAELASIRAVLASSESASYTFDEGEQGQPAYLFERDEGRVLVSVLNGIGGGDADPAWIKVPCDATTMFNAIDSLLSMVRDQLIEAAGSVGERWADTWCQASVAD